jgi:hypothetical protein
MDGLRAFLSDLQRHGTARGNFLGLLNVLIGRHIETADGTVISNGVPWRTLAQVLKRVRWDKEAVRELGLEPSALPPRDRQRYWYLAIVHAHVDSEAAAKAGEQMAEILCSAGYKVGPAPRSARDRKD